MQGSELIPWLPFPMQDISNGEWCPGPQTTKQKRTVRLLAEEADKRAHRLGMSRRDFLRTAAGTATAYMVMNKIDGVAMAGDDAILPVTEEQCSDPIAAAQMFSSDYFVMDVQLHHVDVERFANFRDALCFLRFFEGNLSCEERFQNLSQANMIKEVWVDSETAVGVLSGVPDGIPMGPDVMAQTRDMVNEMSGSRRALSQAMIDPLDPPGRPLATDSLERQVKELGAVAVKTYTGNGNPQKPGWFLDDEEIAYPMLEEAERLGLSMINVHKGFPQIVGAMSADYVRSRDFPKVTRDWPRLNFVAYHSGWFPNDAPGGSNEEFLGVVRSMRGRDNLYAEIGSAFALAITRGSEAMAHFMGSLLKEVDSDHIIWGTDSIWWGSPQFQIDAFKNLEIPVSMQEENGYPPLTESDKAKILGLNAARLYRVDPNEARNEIADDALARLRRSPQSESERTHYAYGLTSRREFFDYLKWTGVA